jgi:hypothetical protein
MNKRETEIEKKRKRSGRHPNKNSRIISLPLPILPIVKILHLPLGMPLGLLAVHKVQALGLEELVGLGAGEGGECLAREAVADGLPLAALRLLPEVHGLEGRGAADQFVGELGAVVLVVLLGLVDLGVGGASFVFFGGLFFCGCQFSCQPFVAMRL